MSDLPPPSSSVPPETPPTPPTPPEPSPAPPEVPVQEPEILSSNGDPLPSAQYDKELGIAMHLLPLLGFVTPGIPVLNLVAPLILWLFKRADSPYLDAHGKEVLNFQITVTIAAVISGLLVAVCIGIPMLIAVAISLVIFAILGAVKASEKKIYRYPLSIKLIK